MRSTEVGLAMEIPGPPSVHVGRREYACILNLGIARGPTMGKDGPPSLHTVNSKQSIAGVGDRQNSGLSIFMHPHSYTVHVRSWTIGSLG